MSSSGDRYSSTSLKRSLGRVVISMIKREVGYGYLDEMRG